MIFKIKRYLDGRSILPFVLGMICLGIYYSPLEYLVRHDWTRDDYSHGMLMPFIVLYLLWERKTVFFSKPGRAEWQGFLLLIPGISLFWIGELAGEYFMLYLSFWMVAVGLCWIYGGMERLKTVWFPICLSLAMFPLPNFLNVKLTFGLRLLSSKLGVWMMQAYGMSAYREGNVIDLGFTKLQVVDACSGLRYLFPMLILSILMAYFYRSGLWKKVVLVVSSIPLTIITNALRIALTGILSERFGSAVVEGFFHDFEGWLIFMITLGVLMGEMWTLNRFFPEAGAAGDEGENDSCSAPVEGTEPGNRLLQPQFVVSVLLLGLTLVLSRGIEFRPAVPMARSFDEFPLVMGEWKGSRAAMEEQFIEALDFTDYVMVDYTDGRGGPINFYVAYYENQSKGESIHSPATCLRGGGWVFKQSGRAEVDLGDGRRLPVSRALIQQGPYQQISYYWFPMRGRMLTNAFEMKWFNFWDALTRQRTDGALVRVIAPVGQGESVEAAEKRLQGFLRQTVPVLETYLPGK